MTSTQIDELVAQANPLGEGELLALAVEDLEGELCAAIMREPLERPRAAAARRWRLPSRGLVRAVEPPRAARRRRLPSRGRVRAVAVAFAACAALVLAGTSLLGTDRGPERAWAAEAVRVANAIPRLLVAGPGWHIQRADEFSVAFGEMTFASGERSFDLHWNAVGRHIDLSKDRANEADLSTTTTVLGHRAHVYRYAGTADDFTALWVQDGYVLEFRGGPHAGRARTLAEFKRVLHALRPASVDAWLSAMPASVVLPVDQRQVVRRMLADIPVPAGFDASALASGDGVRDRYQLGARVAGAAACAWIEQWSRARRNGDRRAAAQAVRALRTSRDWSIVREMQSQGDYSKVLRQYADALAGSGMVMGGKLASVEATYSDALGCE